MIVWLLLGLLAPWFAAYCFVRRCDADSGGAATVWFHALLALGFALGLASCTYFLGLLVCGASGRAYCAIETLAFTLLGLAAWFSPSERGGTSLSLRRAWEPAKPRPRAPCAAWSAQGRATLYTRLLRLIFVAALVAGLLGIAGMLVLEPHGGWDAWAMWNWKARYLFRSGAQWRNAFAPGAPHPDYPLLLSAANARCWTYLGRDPLWIPQLVGVAFTMAAVGLLTAGVARLRGPNQGWLAGLSLLGTVRYLSHGAALYADVPLSFFLLATLLLLALHDAGERPAPGLLVLAGLAAALAAWTKNEGLMFLAIVLSARTAVAWRHGGSRAALREVGPCLIGAAPVLAVVMLFKISIAAENDVVAGQSLHGVLPRLVDASRWILIVRSFIGSAWHVGKALLVILPVAWMVLGAAADRCRRVLPSLVGILGLMLAGFFLVYLTTPFDLSFYVDTSIDRLLVQLWPSALLAVFLYLGDFDCFPHTPLLPENSCLHGSVC